MFCKVVVYLCTQIEFEMFLLNQIESNLPSGLLPPEEGKRFVYLLEIRLDWLTLLAPPIIGRFVNGVCKFYGAEEIVRMYMEKEGLSVMEFHFIVYRKWLDSDYDLVHVGECNLKILFTAAQVTGLPSDPGDFVASHYLIPHSTGVLYPGQHFPLTTGNDRDEDFFFYRADGSSVHAHRSLSPDTLDTYTAEWSSEFVRMEAYIEQEHRFTLYFLDGSAIEHFRFRNVFNCWESVSFPSAVSQDPSEEFDSEFLGTELKKFDAVQMLELTLKSGSLPAFMYDQLLALCRAHRAQYRDGAEWCDIIISKYKFDKSDEPNKPLHLELTFEFADSNRLELMEY